MSLDTGSTGRFELLAFVRSPVPALEPMPRGRARAFVRLWLACLATVLLTAPVAILGSEVSGAGNRIEDVPSGVLVVLALVVAPLLEETAFRLPLAPFRPLWLAIAGAAVAFLVPPYGVVLFGLAVAVAAVPRLRQGTATLWERRFPIVFWTSAVLFGLLHTFNWELDGLGWRAVALVPLLVLPQTGLGLVLGAARVRLGLGGSILLHAAYNGTILAFAF
ncbi:MAG: CPBP family intramembrane metalloprotease [Acidimicrobiia bacterium]|nr:CPBP family intramembrane metalloprotease [Acidimicrobiia bacterium]